MARKLRRRARRLKLNEKLNWAAMSETKTRKFALELGPNFEAVGDDHRVAWFRDDFRRRGIPVWDWKAYAAELSRVYRAKIEPFEDVDYESPCYEFAAIYIWKGKAYTDKLRGRGQPKITVTSKERSEIEKLTKRQRFPLSLWAACNRAAGGDRKRGKQVYDAIWKEQKKSRSLRNEPN